MMMKKVVLLSLVASASAFAQPKGGAAGAPAVPPAAEKKPADAKPPGPPAELAGMAMHATFVTTFDPGSKRFFRQTANGHGGHGTEWGTVEGTKDDGGKTWKFDHDVTCKK